MKNDAENLALQADEQRNNGYGLKAVATYKKAKEAYLSIDNLERAAEMQHMIGVSYKVENDIPQAVESFKLAAEEHKAAGNAEGVARVWRDLGIALAYDHRYHEAEPWLVRSIEGLANGGTRAELGISEAKLGLNYVYLKKYPEAERWMQQGLKHIREQGQWFYEMTVLLQMAGMAIDQQEAEKGLELLGQAETLLTEDDRDKGMQRRLAQIYGLRSHAYLLQGNKPKALEWFNRADEVLAPMSEAVRQPVYEDYDRAFIQSKLEES